jgi:hypothetical protein
MTGGCYFSYSFQNEYGWAWVERWFESKGDGRSCHRLALPPDEMEVVA